MPDESARKPTTARDPASADPFAPDDPFASAPRDPFAPAPHDPIAPAQDPIVATPSALQPTAPALTLESTSHRAPLLERMKSWLREMVRYSRPREPPPPRGNHLNRAAYGAAQPLLGLRLVFSSPELIKEALTPVFWLAVVCAAVAWAKAEPWDGAARILTSPFGIGQGTEVYTGIALWLGRLKEFYKVFAVLAPFPSVIFANHYARFAAQVRFQLGFGPCGPREMPITKSLTRLGMQTVLVAIAIAPFVVIANILPFGEHLGQTLLALWGLNWVVLEAFDDANVLQPGQTLEDVESESESLRRPWFVRIFRWLEARSPARPRGLRRLLRKFGNIVDRLSKPWREESALLEASPRLGLGFAVSTAALLATPILNLVFRPVIIAGATHLLGHIEQDQHAESPEVLHEHAKEEEQEEARPKRLGERLPNLGKRFSGK